MEARWNRAAHHCVLGLDAVNELIRDSGFSAKSAALLQEGKANTNYGLTLDDGRHAVLRIYQRDRTIAPFERAVTEFVARDVPVPRFQYLHPDNSFALTSWIEGETLESLAGRGRQNESDSIAFEIGAALARISDRKFNMPGFLNSEMTVIAEWATTVDGLFGYLFACMARPLVAERTGSDVIRRIERFVRRTEPRLRLATAAPCLVHGDFKVSNLLVADGRLAGVLDWEFAHSGTFLLDVGQLFRHAGCLGPGFEAEFVRGFESTGGSLPEDWRQMAKAVDLVSLVDFLGRDSSGPQMVRDVVGLITGTVGQ
jgi:aminoglycoside phosphotransferase (APT) family kinase protein